MANFLKTSSASTESQIMSNFHGLDMGLKKIVDGVTMDVKIPTGTPASATAAGRAGQIKYDASYLYVCVAANSWKRAAIAAW